MALPRHPTWVSEEHVRDLVLAYQRIGWWQRLLSKPFELQVKYAARSGSRLLAACYDKAVVMFLRAPLRRDTVVAFGATSFVGRGHGVLPPLVEFCVKEAEKLGTRRVVLHTCWASLAHYYEREFGIVTCGLRLPFTGFGLWRGERKLGGP